LYHISVTPFYITQGFWRF